MPKIPALRRVRSQDKDLTQLQDAVATPLAVISRKEILGGQLVEGVELALGATSIPHGLQRDLIGWFVVRQNGNAIIWDSQDDNALSSRTLVLNASAAVTVSLWVF